MCSVDGAAARPDPRPPALSLAEFNKVASITAMGFIAAGFIGFFIKLIFIVSDLAGAAAMRPRCLVLLCSNPLTRDPTPVLLLS